MEALVGKQIQLVEALKENRISDTKQLLSNGAELTARCFFVNHNEPPLHILAEKLHTEQFKEIFEALITNASATVATTVKPTDNPTDVTPLINNPASYNTTTTAATITTTQINTTTIPTTTTSNAAATKTSDTINSVSGHQNELMKLLVKEVVKTCCRYLNKDDSHKLTDVFYENLEIFLSQVTRSSSESLLCKFLCQCSIDLTGSSNRVINEQILFRFVKHFTRTNREAKWNFKGHRMMTPFHVLATLNLSHPGKLLDYGIEQGGDVTATDMFGQTALHTGCSCRNAGFVEAIVSRVDLSLKSAKDKFGWQPACFLIKGTRYFKPVSMSLNKRDTSTFAYDVMAALFIDRLHEYRQEQLDIALLAPVKRHCERECNVCFAKKPSYRRTLNKHLKGEYSFLSSFIEKKYEAYLNDRGDPLAFIHNLLTSRIVGHIDFNLTENENVRRNVMEFVRRVEGVVNANEPLFRCRATLAGSCAEGTKIRAPDEFDINFLLMNFELGKPFLDQNDDLIFSLDRASLSAEELKYTVVVRGICTWDPIAIKAHLLVLVNKAMSTPGIWEGLDLYWRSFGLKRLEVSLKFFYMGFCG